MAGSLPPAAVKTVLDRLVPVLGTATGTGPATGRLAARLAGEHDDDRSAARPKLDRPR